MSSSIDSDEASIESQELQEKDIESNQIKSHEGAKFGADATKAEAL